MKNISYYWTFFFFLSVELASYCQAQSLKPLIGRQLAVSYNLHQPLELPINEYLISEKLDGIRGVWTGTELLTKQGHLIDAPAWFTATWPKVPLDGELWSKRNNFEQTASCVLQKQGRNSTCWRQLRFMLFDFPAEQLSFKQRYHGLQQLVGKGVAHLAVVEQKNVYSYEQLDSWLNKVVKQGGEGLMLHHQDALYRTGRNPSLLKLKKYFDAEAVVLEHLPGKGKFQGKLGALLVKTLPDLNLAAGIVFKIGSGFSDQQRTQPPSVGDIITFKYFGKTRHGTPRFASFVRIRNNRY